IEALVLLDKADAAQFHVFDAQGNFRRQAAFQPDKAFAGGEFFYDLVFGVAEKRRQHGCGAFHILDVAWFTVAGTHLDRNRQRCAVAVHDRPAGRGKRDDALMLLIGSLDHLLVLEDLKIKGSSGDNQKQQAEKRPDHDDPDPGPFFPIILHLTRTTCCSVGSAMPSSFLAMVSMRAGVLREATSRLRRFCSCSASLSRLLASEICRFRSSSLNLDQT